MKTDKFGVEYTDDGETLISCPEDYVGEYAIPDGVIEIAEGAFSGCSSLTSVIIPDSVRFLGENAFFECTSLVSISLPKNLIKIERGTFEFCQSLESIIIRNPKLDICEDSGAFDSCDLLRKIVIPIGSAKHFAALKGFDVVRNFIVEE